MYIFVLKDDNPQNYYRDLNISKATSTVSYEIDGVRYKRTAIASLSENVIAVHCEASKAKSLNFSVSLNSAHQIKQVLVKNGLLVLTGTPAEQENLASKVNYEVDVKVVTKDGNIAFSDSTIDVKSASEATIYIAIGTNFKNYKDLSANPHDVAMASLNKGLKKNLAYYYKNISKIIKSISTV
jgi:alpha-L-fucosidase 2